ncbi:MAG: amidohydrolase [Candidatus Tectomicrobia bacterium]|nr:amidohydrolase [Candidatus Tectomicrobia bacterium]
MAYLSHSKSATVRSKLDHPVIDGDGHWLEPIPILLDYLKDAAGPDIAERYVQSKATEALWYKTSRQERLNARQKRPTWWGEPANTLDRATAMIPRLLCERLDDFGVDFALIYTTIGLPYIANPDDELRRAMCRALNTMSAEMFRPYAQRMTPVAVVPMHTPEEAIEELEFAVTELGMKAIVIANHVRRPIPNHLRDTSSPAAAQHYIDFLALESPYDYDPFWAKCVELKVAITGHSNSVGWEGRTSVDNFTFNHIGHFAGASHVFAKALVLGGVLARFPQLRFALLEGGVGWACNLLTDMIGHWEKRHTQALLDNVRPANVDTQLMADLFAQYGDETYQLKMDELMSCLSSINPFNSLAELTERESSHEMDDFAAANITCADDLRALFAERFFFGCEADDPTTAWAFNDKHRLNPMFSSDVGHFDVIDMSEVLEEAHELLEDGLISEDAFREFVFTNAARLHTSLNPDFFKGTVVEDAVAQHVLQAAPRNEAVVAGDD